MIFAIPSYKRSHRQWTVEYLRKLGYSKKDIFVFTQTNEDYKAYKEAWGDKATIIMKKAHNVASARNNILEYFQGEHLMIIDDDIKRIHVLQIKDGKKKTLKVDDRETFDLILSHGFQLMKKYNAVWWGIYSTSNPYFLSYTVSVGYPFASTFNGFHAIPSVRFDPNMPVKEDYELQIRLNLTGRPAIRLDFIYPETKYWAEGGCEDIRRQGKENEAYAKLFQKYGRYLQKTKDPRFIRFKKNYPRYKEEVELWL